MFSDVIQKWSFYSIYLILSMKYKSHRDAPALRCIFSVQTAYFKPVYGPKIEIYTAPAVSTT
jgi:hypothetical protein